MLPLPTTCLTVLRRLTATAALLALFARPASAQFNDFYWTLQDDSGDGFVSLSSDTMLTVANWPSANNAFLLYEAVAPVDGRVSVDMWYMTFDGACGKSLPVFVLNGVPTILANCTESKSLVFSVPAGAEFGFGLQTFDGTWPGWAQWTNFHFTPVPYFEAWTDLGSALAGAGGVPSLAGTSLLYPHFPFELLLTHAASNAPVALIVGFSQLNGAFKGGVLVPSPDFVVTGLGTDVHGAMVLDAGWLGAPSGLSFYMQAWIADASGPSGFAASNALKAEVP
jgi:hypothetical protein